MSKTDFAIKDFTRKKEQTYPYILIITFIIAVAVFLIYFTSSLGLNQVSLSFLGSETTNNELFFSGSINMVYSQFNTFIITLLLVLTFTVVVVITTTLVITKKRDIAIMKALGTLPGNLYGFYLIECYIIFLIGFLLGLVLGLISFGAFATVMFFLNVPIIIQIDFFYIPILFLSCLVGIFLVTGYKLRKIGNENIIKSFSKDIRFDYDASAGLTFLPLWLSKRGFNLKTAIVNTVRRRGEYRRYILIFTIIFMIIFTLGLGTIVLNNSTQEWIHRAQGDNIVVIGHEDTVDYYSKMYEMFSDPTIEITRNDIDFTDSKYLFNLTDIDGINNIDEIEKVDERLIAFCDAEELDGYHYLVRDNVSESGYEIVGQQRTGTFPVMGVNNEKIIQNFEMEGRFPNDLDAELNITIGDGLAYNFFDYAFDQSIRLLDISHNFHIIGVAIDSFFSGYAGYVDLAKYQEYWNLTNSQQEINVVLVQITEGSYNDIVEDLNAAIHTYLSQSFTCMSLDAIFEGNLAYLSYLSFYPLFLIIVLTVVSILALYNYQKAGLMDKAKDFLIMRAIGSKVKDLRRMMYLESLFIIIPSLLLSLSIGMILNSLILLERVYLPPLFVPFAVMGIIFVALLIINYLSIIPISKKIDEFRVSNFSVF